MGGRRGSTVPLARIDVGTFYRRRCGVTQIKLGLWHDQVWYGTWVVRAIEPEDPLTDKEPAGYVLELQRRWRGSYEYDDRRVDAGAVLQVAADHIGLREVC